MILGFNASLLFLYRSLLSTMCLNKMSGVPDAGQVPLRLLDNSRIKSPVSVKLENTSWHILLLRVMLRC